MRNEVYKDCLNSVKNKGGLPFWKELSIKHGYPSKNAIRVAFNNERKKRGDAINESDYYKETIEIKEDGSIFSDRLVEICESDLKNPEKMLIAHGFEVDKWVIVSCKNNLWHGMRTKDRGRIILYQSKLVVKPIVDSGLTLADIDDFFNKASFNIEKKKRQSIPNKSGNVLEINLADLHIGALAISEDENSSLSEKCFRVVDDIIERTKDMKIEKILLVQLGDIFHFDTFTTTTSRGTHMSTDRSFPSMFDEGVNIMIEMVERLTAVAPVEIINIFGNHDKITSYTLGKSLEFYFKDRKDVEVDTSHLSRKARVFGKCLVVWAHGDMPKKSIFSLPQKEFRKEFGETEYAEIHAGHFHSQSTQEKDGSIVRYLPSMSNLDGWSYEQGYTGGLKSTISFLWNMDDGLKAIWFTNV